MFFSFCKGDTIYISRSGNNTESCGTRLHPCATIQYGVDLSNTGDIVYVNNGFYEISSKIIITKQITLQAGDGLVVLTCDHIKSTALYLGGNVLVDGFLIRDCDNSAVQVSGFNNSIHNTLFTNNIGINGAAITNYGDNSTSLSIVFCAFDKGYSSNDGGAISIQTSEISSLEVYRANFTGNNSTGYGSGIFLLFTNLTINDCIFEYNDCGNGGCGVTAVGSDNVIIEDSIFRYNSGSSILSSGSALFVSQTESLHIINTEIYSNSVLNLSNKLYGAGAVLIDTVQNCFIKQSKFYDNLFSVRGTHTFGGGAIQIQGNRTETILIEDSSFYNNTVIGNFEYPAANFLINLVKDVFLTNVYSSTYNQFAFKNHEYLYGYIGYIFCESAIITNSSFSDSNLIFNSKTSKGAVRGLLYSITSTNILISNSNFDNNFINPHNIKYELTISGCILDLIDAEYITTNNCSFSNNFIYSKYYDGGFLFLSGALEIESSFLKEANILNSKFNSNIIQIDETANSFFSIYGAGFSMLQSYNSEIITIIIDNCEFIGNSIFILEDVAPSQTFNQISGAGLQIEIPKSNIFIRNSRFTKNELFFSGYTGLVQGTSMIITSDENIELCYNSFSDNIATVLNTVCDPELSIDTRGSLVLNATNINVLNSNFINNTVDVTCGLSHNALVYGGAISILPCSKTNNTIHNCEFKNNYVKGFIGLGGAIYVNEIHSLLNSTFIGNSAFGTKPLNELVYGIGGGCYTHTVHEFNNIYFENNIATFGGGACINSVESLSNITFINNSAEIGGGLFLSNNTKKQYVNHYGVYINNTAEYYGNNAATGPRKLESSRNISITTPGQKFSLKFIIYDSFFNPIGGLVDLLLNTNQDIYFITNVPDNVLTNTVSNPYYELNGAYFETNPSIEPFYVSFQGIISNLDNFNDLNLNQEQNDSQDNFNSIKNLNDTLQFYVQNCLPNHYYSSDIFSCIQCLENEYNFNSDFCTKCPLEDDSNSCMDTYANGNELNGNYTTIIGPGVWPYPNFINPNELIECPFENSCLKLNCSTISDIIDTTWNIDCSMGYTAISSVNQSPYCEEGYTDRLCSRCVCNDKDNCYYESGGLCKECEIGETILFYITMIGFLVITGIFFVLPLGGFVLVLGKIGITLLLAFTGFISWMGFVSSSWVLFLIAVLDDNVNSAVLKSMLTFLQLVPYICNPNFWPSWLPLGNIGEGGVFILPGIDCMITGFAQNPEWKYIFSMLVPLILIIEVIILSLLTYPLKVCIKKYFKKNNTNEKPNENTLLINVDESSNNERNLENNSTPSLYSIAFNEETLKAVLFIAYTSYLYLVGGIFTILQPCTNGYFTQTPWIECSFDNSTYTYLIISAIFFGIIYVIGIPLLFGFLLYYYRDQIHSKTPIARAVNFLHQEYRPQMYYYELIWTLRRLLLVCGIFLIPQSSPYQFAFCFSVLSVGIFLQSICSPFKRRRDNFAEILASLSLITLYSVSNITVLLDTTYQGINDIFTIFFIIVLTGLFLETFYPFIRTKILRRTPIDENNKSNTEQDTTTEIEDE